MVCWGGIIIWPDYLSIMLVHCHYLRLLLAVDKEGPEESEEERNSCNAKTNWMRGAVPVLTPPYAGTVPQLYPPSTEGCLHLQEEVQTWPFR